MLVALIVLAGASTPVPASTGDHSQYDVWIESFDGLMLDATVFRPAAADTGDVPMIVHSHGWGGSKATSGFDAWLDAGFGVLSFSQRGHGETGGTSQVMDPDYEGQDVKAVLDHVAGLDWVQLDAPGDPVVGALGGSYGGGYQWVGAFTELAESGATRFDALSPEITWYDLPDSLAPDRVVRTAWVTGLYGSGVQMLPQDIHVAYWYAMATGELPDGSVPGTPDIMAELRENGPVSFVEEQGLQLDVPVLMRQGLADTLFNFNQAYRNYWYSLTDDARADSFLVGQNDGHQQLYPAFNHPQGGGALGDPCGDALGGWEDLQIRFHQKQLMGASVALPGAPFHLATFDNGCVSSHHIGPDGVDATIDLVATTSATGAPQYVEVAEGPLTVAGVSRLQATVASAAVDQRIFFGLAVGTSPADAKVLGKAFMPVRIDDATLGTDVDMELAGVAATLQEGERLFLVVAPQVDQFALHGSRVAGAVVLQDVSVDLPVQGDGAPLPAQAASQAKAKAAEPGAGRAEAGREHRP